MNKKLKVILTTALILVMLTVPVFAENVWAKNGYDWIKDGVWWISLIVVIVVAAKLLLKKMFTQFIGFAVLASIVLVIIDAPERLKSIGTTIWSIIFGG